MMLGEAEVTIVSDGTLPLGPPKGTFVGVPDEEVKKMLTDNFLDPENVVLEQNSPIVNTGDKLILFDTGMGTSKAFGPTTGRQQKSMAEAGIKPADIDAVVLSHAHIDHIGGIVGTDDKPLFPNAQYYITQSDFEFWTDEGNKLGGCAEGFRGSCPQEFAAGARPHRLHQGWSGIPARRAGDRGARAYRRPHHLHGELGRQILRLPRRSLASPRAVAREAADGVLLSTPIPKQAAATRVKLLDMIATNKLPVMSYHYAWPGFGNIAKAGDGFHYYPASMKMEL